jgi:hypothetical protein
VFESVLTPEAAQRATFVVHTVLAHGLRSALAGSLARAVRLQAHGRLTAPRQLHDIDLVVADFAAIPPSLAGTFLLNHVHPSAAEGKTLIQLIDATQALRVDVFRALGCSLARADRMDVVAPLPVLSVEDLRARATAMVYLHLERGCPIDPKHVAAFHELGGLGDRHALDAAWAEHRQDASGSFDEVHRHACRLVETRPELLVPERYSAVIEPCDRCQTAGSFRPSAPEKIVEVLGYW